MPSDILNEYAPHKDDDYFILHIDRHAPHESYIAGNLFNAEFHFSSRSEFLRLKSYRPPLHLVNCLMRHSPLEPLAPPRHPAPYPP